MSGRQTANGRPEVRERDRPNGLALQRKAAAEACGMGVDSFDREVRPYVPVARIGSMRLWRVADLERFIADRLEDPATIGRAG